MGAPAFYRKGKEIAVCDCSGHGAHHKGEHYRRLRKGQNQQRYEHEAMPRKIRRGRDYTPLFRFLLSKVGESWDAVYKEAVSRLDSPEPIFWLVSSHLSEGLQDVVRIGIHSYYSRLYVDDNKRLQKVNPSLTTKDFYPACSCCTHSFNGELFDNDWVRLRH
ncbi:MAG: hypothetical protein EP343_24315 [Deltaproteobacteria bacterium]|nr:MAG: hypothetical protein EP343_24315 [Deltaproteobacteria bacterium]